MTALEKLLTAFREAAQTEREKGSYFEEMVNAYLFNDRVYRRIKEIHPKEVACDW